MPLSRVPVPAFGSCRTRGRTERAHRCLQNARTRFAQLPPRIIVFSLPEDRQTRTPSASRAAITHRFCGGGRCTYCVRTPTVLNAQRVSRLERTGPCAIL